MPIVRLNPPRPFYMPKAQEDFHIWRERLYTNFCCSCLKEVDTRNTIEAFLCDDCYDKSCFFEISTSSMCRKKYKELTDQLPVGMRYKEPEILRPRIANWAFTTIGTAMTNPTNEIVIPDIHYDSN